MHQPNTLPSKSSISNTPAGVEPIAPAHGDLVKLVEQLQDKLLELENRLLKMTGDHHLMLVAYQQLKSPVNFMVLDRLEQIEARLDSIDPRPPG